MKAERRHELQENSLAHVLSNLPLYLSIYGGRILLFLSLIVLVVVLLNYRKQAKLQQSVSARVSLSTAREGTLQLAQLSGTFADPSQIAQQRALLRSQVDSSLEIAAGSADTTTLKAEAEVARGDLFWTLANLPELRGASTQPALAIPEKPDQLLKQAEAAYESVLSLYPNEKFSRGSALLGLGAIAENRGAFDVAEQRYKQLAESDLSPTQKILAEERIEMLPILAKPRRIVAASQPATQPAGAPFISFDQPLQDLPVEPIASPTTLPSN
ncbi:MAG TPA: hypothetical protein PLD59_08425 [Tepidisphaeraceae bacterium]|nr:hypothetical protein [Tepidisphaeraceae bacterium]